MSKEQYSNSSLKVQDSYNTRWSADLVESVLVADGFALDDLLVEGVLLVLLDFDALLLEHRVVAVCLVTFEANVVHLTDVLNVEDSEALLELFGQFFDVLLVT